MDLAAGYKITEVGIIPEDWEVKQISDVAEICGGGTPSTSEKSFWGGDINWFTPAEINDSVVFVTESERKITKEGLKQSSAKLLPKGTILLTTRATIGSRAISKCMASTNQGFQSLIPKEGYYNLFLYYIIPSLKNEMIARASGSTFLEISSSKLSSIKFAVPSYKEQVLIGDAIHCLDTLIASLDSQILKKKEIMEGTMQGLLTGRVRLPGFEKKWEKYSLKDVANLYYGYLYTPDKYVDTGKYSVITIGNVQGGKFISAGCNKTDFIPSSFSDKQFINKGDVLISMTGNVGRVCKSSIDNGVMNYRVGKIEAKKFSLGFLYWTMQTPNFLNSMISSAKGAAQLNISRDDFEKYTFMAPTDEVEQNRIAIILSTMEDEINTLETDRDKYLLIKQGMMQDLLTGKTRLI